ncbi:MAG: hypothetical protein AAF810_01610 [Cyanobacteria bacterium P01_D01_bin.36]
MALINPFQSTAVFVLETFCDQLWGFKPNLIRPLVRQKGAVRSLFWFIPNMLKYEGILERWGPIRTHLVAVHLCAINGCRYCVFGHAYALELTYLKQTGQLFPLTEHQLMNLCGQNEADILTTLQHALTEANLNGEILTLQRLGELYHRPELATTQSDHQLTHLIRLFATLNACGIKSNLQTDQAHDPINKNRAMRDRYQALRQSQQSTPANTQPTGVTILNPADISAEPINLSTGFL